METTTNKAQVASTITAQLGPVTLAMLGAHDLAYDANGLQFRIRGSRRVSLLVITLACDDTYTVDAYKGRGVNLRRVANMSMVYVDSLHEVIASMTGLYTRL